MNLYQHFRMEEHAFVDQVMNWKDQVETTYSFKLTDFLDPREQQIVTIIIGTNEEVKVKFFGGAKGAERKRALLYPDFYSVEDQDFRIGLLEVIYPNKFVTIEHRQVLGSLMSLGLKRGKYGDILINHEQIQIIVAEEISEYIKSQLESIGRAKVSVEARPLSEAVEIEENWRELTATVSSMRLDVIVASLNNLSRQKAQSLILGGFVKVNWALTEQTSFECAEGDVISVRGFGRSKLMTIEGKTKKEKWRIVAQKQN